MRARAATLLSRGFWWAAIASAHVLFAHFSPAQTESLRVVAIGASNTSGWGVGSDRAYPYLLEQMLRSHGYVVQVTNAGIPFDTTGGMLSRLNSAVPDGTHIVILQPGGNDRRFFISAERRASNIGEIVARLRARHLDPIVYDPIFPRDFYGFDGIHFTAEAHAKVAEELLPQVLATIQRDGRPSDGTTPALKLSR
jgi:acyl-CoA thioesterase-1